MMLGVPPETGKVHVDNRVSIGTLVSRDYTINNATDVVTLFTKITFVVKVPAMTQKLLLSDLKDILKL